MKFTKLIASLAAITTVLSTMGITAFPVIAGQAENEEAHAWMYEIGATSKATFGEFAFESNVTREAAAKFLSVVAMELGLDSESDQECDFSDLNSADNTLVDSIMDACGMGIFKAQDMFNPKSVLTRAQAELTVARIVYGMDAVNDYADENDVTEFVAANEMLMDAGIITVNVNGQSAVKRGHLALMLLRMSGMDLPDPTPCTVGVDCPVLPGTGDTGQVVEVKAGNLELSMVSAPANGSSIPSAGVVTFGKFSFAAGSDDISVRSVVVERAGLGARDDVSRVYFEKDGIRISGRSALGSDGRATVTFSPALVVKKNSAEMLDFIASLSGAAGSEHMFRFLSVDSSAVTATITPSNLATPTLRTTTYQVANAEFEKLGSALTHRAGGTSMLELGQFRISNVNVANQEKDILVKSIKFRNALDGDVAASLANVGLYRNGIKVSTNAIMNGKDVTFTLNDTIRASENGLYYIKGEVINVDQTAGDNYQFQLRNTEDLNVIESSTLFRSTVSLKLGSSYTLAAYLVQGGDVTFTRDSALQLSQTVSPGTNGVVLMKGTITARVPVTLEDLSLAFATADANLVNKVSQFTLRIGNSSSNFTPTASLYTTGAFDGAFRVVGTTTFEITANIKTTATGGTIQFTSLDANDFTTVEYDSLNSAKSSSVGSIASAIATINLSALNLTRTDGLSARNVVAGVQDMVYIGGRFSTAQNGSVTISSFNLSGTAATTNFDNNVTAQIYVNGSANSIGNATLANGTMSFSSFSNPIVVTSANPVNFQIKVSINQGVSAGTLSMMLTGVTATDSNSQTVTVAGVNAANVTIATAGSATVATTSTTPSRQLLVAGESTKELARFTIAASNDNLRLTDMFFTNLIAGNANSGFDIGNRLSNIRLYDTTNMTTALATATNVTTNVIAFENLDSTDIQVTPTTVKTFVLKADVNTVNDSGDLLDNTIELMLGTGTYVPTRTVYSGTRFVSMGNGQDLTGAQTTVTPSNITIANGHRVVRASINFSKTSTQEVTTEKVMQFVVSPIGNQVTLSGVTVLLNGISGSATVNIYRSDDTTLVASGVVSNNSIASLSFMNGGENITSASTYYIRLVPGYTPLSISSNNLARRELSITQFQYIDMFNNNGTKLYTDVASFNVGLPLTANSFTQ